MLCFNDEEKGKVQKDCMERIMNEENDWDHNVEGAEVDGSVVCASREEVVFPYRVLKVEVRVLRKDFIE